MPDRNEKRDILINDHPLYKEKIRKSTDGLGEARDLMVAGMDAWAWKDPGG